MFTFFTLPFAVALPKAGGCFLKSFNESKSEGGGVAFFLEVGALYLILLVIIIKENVMVGACSALGGNKYIWIQPFVLFHTSCKSPSSTIVD
jgi:hypothetical protein